MIFFLFVTGLFVGSFLLVVADRISKGDLPAGRKEGIVWGRSKCDKCKTPLGVIDLIPVLSYLFLGAKCRFCKVSLSPKYILGELTTGILFASVPIFLSVHSITFEGAGFWYFIYLFFYLFVISALIIIFFSDLLYGVIPD